MRPSRVAKYLKSAHIDGLVCAVTDVLVVHVVAGSGRQYLLAGSGGQGTMAGQVLMSVIWP